MALDARTRSSIYGKFAEILGDHDANALMTQFPSIEADELVTKQFLRAELGSVRHDLLGEIGSVRQELLGEIGSVRQELLGEIGSVRQELLGEIGSVRSELRGEIGGLRFEMVDGFHRQTVWLTGTVLASAAAVVAAIPLLS